MHVAILNHPTYTCIHVHVYRKYLDGNGYKKQGLTNGLYEKVI